MTCGVDSFIPELEYLIEKKIHGLFFKKKPSKSDSWIQIHEMKLIPSTQSNLFPILICFFLIPRNFPFLSNYCELSRAWFVEKKMELPSQDVSKTILLYFLPNSDLFRIRSGAVRRPCTKNVWNEPVQEMLCVVKRETFPVRRWKFCVVKRETFPVRR